MILMGFLVLEYGEYVTEDPKQYERHEKNAERTGKAFFVRFPIMRDKRKVIVHEPGKGQRKCLAADHDIPPHHKNSEKDQYGTDHNPFYGRARDQEKRKRYKVAHSILQDEYIEEILAVNYAPQNIP